MRILYAGNFGESADGALFHTTTRRISNGFARNGHDVLPFSIREIARASAPLHIKQLGVKAMNRRLLETVENYAPDMILLAQASLIERSTLQAIRARANRPRLAIRNLDMLESGTGAELAPSRRSRRRHLHDHGG